MAPRLRVGRLPPVRRKLPPRAPPKKRRGPPRKPAFHIADMLAWADEHRQRTGYWPIARSGEIHLAPWDTWLRVDDALRRGYRGCLPGGSLAKLLRKYRGKLPRKGYPRKATLTMEQILAWADAFRKRTGDWPVASSPGPVARWRDETWLDVDRGLRRGIRGLPGDDSLAQVLLRHCGVRRSSLRPRLTIKQILAWADAFHERKGRWPSARSGDVEGVPGEQWKLIHKSLEDGRRGLPAGYTLATLLSKYRGHRCRRNLPPFTESAILAWADAHHHRHRSWPTLSSGPIPRSQGETWGKVEGALSKGRRGLPGGDSLSQFLTRHKRRPRRNRGHHPARHSRLTIKQILVWADEFHHREGRWPAHSSGRIKGTRNETWLSVDNALRRGMRGLQRGSSVALLLEKRRGARHKHHRPRLTNRDILAWAGAHHRREGRWPSAASGSIPESDGDTWRAVESALRNGSRGRPGGDSLTRFLRRHGRPRRQLRQPSRQADQVPRRSA